jgi:hypothetical protein
VHQIELHYDDHAIEAPLPLDLPQPDWAETGIILGPAVASDWLAELFRRLMHDIEHLASDRAIRDYLLQTAVETDYVSIRDAALLTKHLGHLDELPSLLDREREALEAVRALRGHLEHNDRDTNMVMWSPRRFAEFLDAAPP